MQRHRAFGDFADLEARYHRRPSAWVAPEGDWGPGHVMLVEIPADKEIYDNVVAFWRPEAPLAAGEETMLRYDVHWGEAPFAPQPLLAVRDTRMGRDPFGQGITVVIDFTAPPAGGPLEGLTAMVEASDAIAPRGVIIQRNPETGGPRLAFHFDPGQRVAVELRAALIHDHAPASETWLYRWTL